MMHEELLKRHFEQESSKGDLSPEQWGTVFSHVKTQKQRRLSWGLVTSFVPRRPVGDIRRDLWPSTNPRLRSEQRAGSSWQRLVQTWRLRWVGVGVALFMTLGAVGYAVGPLLVSPTIEDIPPEGVEVLLSGDVLDRFRALPTDYQEALAAYLAFGVSPDLVPIVVEQKMAQWPEDPPPLRDLLGPDRHKSFKNLYEPNPGAPYYAYFLLTFYVHLLNNEDTLEGQGQALQDLLDALLGTTPALESVLTPAELARLDQLGPSFQQAIRSPWREAQVSRPPLESVLTPTALARLDQLGPSFQRAIRSPSAWYDPGEMDLQTFAVMFTLFEILLLKTPAGTELPSNEAYLSEQELVELKALPEEIQDTVEPAFQVRVLDWYAGNAIYPSVTTLTLPPADDFLSGPAKSTLLIAKVRAEAGKEE